ncbi:hypothetical protein Cni_G19676 [Canna indica]|uniref:Uncharacterized protein n=1 Tax=Canna indica TaxID=4628 RepID=A0AAQ3KL04_9LILI|nr:hypothetical protein Cni_G19676 [Canna indica]
MNQVALSFRRRCCQPHDSGFIGWCSFVRDHDRASYLQLLLLMLVPASSAHVCVSVLMHTSIEDVPIYPLQDVLRHTDEIFRSKSEAEVGKINGDEAAPEEAASFPA